MKATNQQPTGMLETLFRRSCVLAILVAALAMGLASQATAQTFTTLHTFTATGRDPGINFICPYTNPDGAFPDGPLILSSNILYGTTEQGGTGAARTVVAVNAGRS